MNAPSRSMPPPAAPQKMTFAAWLAAVVFTGGLLWAAAESIALRWAIGGSTALLVVLTGIHQVRLRRLREERKAESICTFARALPAKEHDAWVVRAVYEEVSQCVRAPIRPSDDVVRFWGIDGDDLDDAALRIAERVGRSMEDVHTNPYFGKVRTVADMVAFIEHQPKLPNQSPEPTPGSVTPRANLPKSE